MPAFFLVIAFPECPILFVTIVILFVLLSLLAASFFIGYFFLIIFCYQVEAKRALSREEQQTSVRSANPSSGRSASGGGANIRTKKIFVGGLPPTLTEDGFRQYFQTYGNVTDVVVMYDQQTQRPRGFGFISFDTEDAVDRVLHKTFHELNGKLVEVKRALPKDANPSSGGGRSQSYGGSGQSAASYDNRMEANRYMQQQQTGGGYPTYGSSAYGAPSYGYGGASNVGYGGYGVSGYGSASAAGYGGPAGAYGNPNAAGGYVSGPPGAAPRSPWTNQAPTGYGSSGYGGNTAYGAASSWGTSAGGAGGAAPTSQSPNSAYGNQGYGGYGGYGGADGAYASQGGGYGAVGGRGGGPTNNAASGSGVQGAGYMGGGYGDANGSSGYSNAWRSDPSQAAAYGSGQVNGPAGGPANYGGGYGGSQGRQPQQQ